MAENVKLRANVPLGPSRLFSPGYGKFAKNLGTYGKEWGRRIASPFKLMAKAGGAVLGKNDISLQELQEAILGGITAGMPGGGTGVANIGRKDLLKSFAKQYRNITAMRTRRRRALDQGVDPRSVTEGNNPLARELKPKLDKRYREVVRSSHTTPQSELDRIRGVVLTAKPPNNRGKLTAGTYYPGTRMIDMNISGKMKPYHIPDTWFHEFGHSRTHNPPEIYKKGMPLSKSNRRIDETQRSDWIEEMSENVPYESQAREIQSNKFGELASFATRESENLRGELTKLSSKNFGRLFNKSARIAKDMVKTNIAADKINKLNAYRKVVKKRNTDADTKLLDDKIDKLSKEFHKYYKRANVRNKKARELAERITLQWE